MAEGPYYAHNTYGRSPQWELWKHSSRGGDRRLAESMSEATAKHVAKLMNADHVAREKYLESLMNETRPQPQPSMELPRGWRDDNDMPTA